MADWESIVRRLERIENALTALKLPKQEKYFYSTEEAAGRLGLSKWYVRRLFSLGEIKAEKHPESGGDSTFDAARISRFEVTRVAVPRRWRSFHGLGAAFHCVRSSDSPQLSSYAVLDSRVVASRVYGRGRSESPSTAVACLGCQFNSSQDGDGAARRWGCNHRTLVSAVTRGETPPPAE